MTLDEAITALQAARAVSGGGALLGLAVPGPGGLTTRAVYFGGPIEFESVRGHHGYVLVGYPDPSPAKEKAADRKAQRDGFATGSHGVLGGATDAPLVPCPVCGGEAAHAQDVLARTVIQPDLRCICAEAPGGKCICGCGATGVPACLPPCSCTVGAGVYCYLHGGTFMGVDAAGRPWWRVWSGVFRRSEAKADLDALGHLAAVAPFTPPAADVESPVTCWGLSSFCAEVGHKCRAAGACVYAPPVAPKP